MYRGYNDNIYDNIYHDYNCSQTSREIVTLKR